MFCLPKNSDLEKINTLSALLKEAQSKISLLEKDLSLINVDYLNLMEKLTQKDICIEELKECNKNKDLLLKEKEDEKDLLLKDKEVLLQEKEVLLKEKEDYNLISKLEEKNIQFEDKNTQYEEFRIEELNNDFRIEELNNEIEKIEIIRETKKKRQYNRKKK